MGLLIEGKWHDKWYDTGGDGRFKREEAKFRDWLSADGGPGPDGQRGYRAEEAGRGPPRRQRRGRRRESPAPTDPGGDVAGLESHEDRRLPPVGRPYAADAGDARPTVNAGLRDWRGVGGVAPTYGLTTPSGQSTRLRPWYSSSISRLSRASTFIRSLNDRLRAFSSNRYWSRSKSFRCIFVWKMFSR